MVLNSDDELDGDSDVSCDWEYKSEDNGPIIEPEIQIPHTIEVLSLITCLACNNKHRQQPKPQQQHTPPQQMIIQ